MTPPVPRPILIGTAGHIDHGKTRLVGRLTGINTDRLPEEKARGISIDLGFAHWEAGGFEFGVVDVPGHERFVRNMVAGATGVNLALLVVAADDGVMPQTREHLDIMDLLGLPAGAVAITKCDLVDPELIELVRAEITELTAGTFLERAPIVAVSSETGSGLDDLKAVLVELAGQQSARQTQNWFRLPIDRVFSLTGHGTVVTGSVLHGQVHPGDQLELLPAQELYRVRSVQHHGLDTNEGMACQRTAVNLAGAKIESLHRGQELATPGILQPSRRLVVELRCLSSAPVVMKDRQEYALHIGTSEHVVRLVLKGQTLQAGDTGVAELRCREPLLAAWGQRFVLRVISPAATVAGGVILDPGLTAGKRIKELPEYAGECRSPDPHRRLSLFLSSLDAIPPVAPDACWRFGISGEEYPRLVEELKQSGVLLEIGRTGHRLWLHRDRVQQIGSAMLRAIRTRLQELQPRRSLPVETIHNLCREIASRELVRAVQEHLVRTRELALVGENLGPADLQVELTKRQRQTLDQVLTAIRAAGLTPPTVKELRESLDLKPEQLQPLLTLAVEDSLLIPLNDTLYISPASLELARQRCDQYFQHHATATVSELREVWGVTRKHAVPLSELCDERGITVRAGDQRSPGPHLKRPVP